MRKRLIGLLTFIALILSLAGVLTACGDGGENYSVTVLSPAEEPMAGVTVSWISGSKAEGVAVTNGEGKATASLPLGTYTVSLDGYGEGYTYTSVSVSASMRNVTLTLSSMKVRYAATVKDKTGAPAGGVIVTWSNGNTVAGTAETNANGVAAIELDYGDYDVTLSNLPDGNVADGAKVATGKAPSIAFNLTEGVAVRYEVTVKSEGGLPFNRQLVRIYDSNNRLVTNGNTDENGVYSFTAKQSNYTAAVAALPEGYKMKARAELTADTYSANIVLQSSVIMSLPSSGKRYVMGDIFHNYTFTTPYEIDGKVWSKSVSEILETKQALIINNWGTGCSNCVYEMPAMQEAYEKYKDVLEIVAVDNYISASGIDSNETITQFIQEGQYTFPAMRDENGFTAKFGIEGWPTTIIVDRYGAIARIEVGAVTTFEAWERMIQKYIGDDYVQSFTPGDSVSDSIITEISKPDVEIPADHYEKIAAAMNDKNLIPNGASIVWYGETEYEYAWPFILGTDTDISGDVVMYSSNTGKVNSMSILYATVTVDAGKVLRFDYWSQTEEDEDVLSIVWDGKIVKRISGDSEGWQTCYLYADLTGGSHTMSVTYIKDGQINTGKDNVYFKQFGFADIEDIPGSENMYRSAAYGTPAVGATVFPYYASVELGEDGYYYVNAGALENPQFAGNDPKPMLFVNLLGATQWNVNSINAWTNAKDEKTGNYIANCTFEIGGVTQDWRPTLISYLRAASSSYVDNCVPVNKELHDILVKFMGGISGRTSHENEWLEACYFYSHYGEGDPIGNPILGVMEKTAIPVEEGKTTANLTRNMYPFPVEIFTFTPTESAVYELKSLISAADAAKMQAQVWLYDDKTGSDKPLAYCGDGHVTRDGVNEQNFEVYHYMTAGHKYYIAVAFLMAERGTLDFTITKVGASKTVMIPCSEDVYTMILDDKGNMTGDIFLAGAIKYVKDNDGFYHAINPDGTTGDFIYLDVKYATTTALGTIPITRLVDKFVQDPGTRKDLDYKFFDFRYRILYIRNEDEAGEIINYQPKTDWTQYGEQYKDYTETVKGWIAAADADGLVKVTQEIVDVMQLFVEMRTNAVYLDNATQKYEIDKVLDNEWLRFCWYNRTYDSNNI